MAWTAPRTWTTGELVTAAFLNTHVRDNLLETAPAKVTTAGDLVYATAANTLTRLAIGSATTVLHGGASAPIWLPIATADIVDDAVDDSKAGYRVLRLDRRKGGDATAWNITGTTSYTPTTVRCQVGSAEWTGGAAVSGSLAITFPTSFSAIPLAFCISGDSFVSVGVTSPAMGGFTADWNTLDGVTTKTSVTLYWLAVGSE